MTEATFQDEHSKPQIELKPLFGFYCVTCENEWKMTELKLIGERKAGTRLVCPTCHDVRFSITITLR